MKYIVYCTVCTENGKIYIGVHKTENPEVFDGYIGNGIKKGYCVKNPKTPFQYAVKKYGFNKFKRNILFVFGTEEEAYKKEAEIVTYDFIKRKDNYNSSLGGVLPGNHYKYIYRYKLDGTFWEEYFGINFLAEKFSCSVQNFYKACDNKTSFKNSYWSYEKLEKLNLSLYKLNKFSTIYQFDSQGNYIREWETVRQIEKELNLTYSNIISSLNKKTLAGGFYFTKNKENIIKILKSKEIYNSLPTILPGEKRKIAQYDLENNLIKIWDSVSECAKTFSKCRDVAKGIRTQTKGYIFKYIS